MVPGNAYRSIGVFLLIVGICYILTATTISRVQFQDFVLRQPAPTDNIQKAMLHKQADHNATYIDISIMKPSIEGHTNISKLRNRVVLDKHSGTSWNNYDRLTLNGTKDKASSVTVLSKKKIVIIVAYMRTGSTLTASVLQEYPGTFYVFEPIRSVHSIFKEYRDKNKTRTNIEYLHGIKRNYTDSDEADVTAVEINNWLTCRLDQLSLRSLNDDFHFHYTKIMKRFYLCAKGPLKSQRKGKFVNIHPYLRRYFEASRNIDACLTSAITYCQSAPLSVLKFIRVRMEQMLKLLPLYPNLKVIHLVRDPRGIFNSRFKTNLISRKNFQSNVNSHCSAVYDDLKYSKKILEMYNDRLKIVHYEDMAEDPIGISRDIADFVGIEFLPNMKNYVRQQTSSSRDSCAYCTQRKNSNSTANKWRNQLDPKLADDIYTACKSSNDVLGYLPLNVISLGNMKYSSRKRVDVENVLRSDLFH